MYAYVLWIACAKEILLSQKSYALKSYTLQSSTFLIDCFGTEVPRLKIHV